MSRKILLLVLLSTLCIPAAFADEVTRIIQEDLTALGYNTGGATGEMTTETIIAISKFQSENNLEVTGEPTPQLAGIIKSKSAPQLKANVPVAATADPAALQAAQQACLQQKVTAAQATKKKKRGFGSLMSAIGRTAAQVGGMDMSSQIYKVSSDIYAANATASDLKSAAKDLGLTEDDIESCRNPAM